MTASQLDFNYFSPTKLVQFMNDLFNEHKLKYLPKPNEKLELIEIWYKGIDTYKSKFDCYCIRKPVYIKLTTSHHRGILIDHKTILSLFDSKPVIQFSQDMYRRLPIGDEKNNMFYLSIQCKAKETSDGFTYYPIRVNKETIKNIINRIESQIINIDEFEESDESSSDTV